jgi:hypothetical protein
MCRTRWLLARLEVLQPAVLQQRCDARGGCRLALRCYSQLYSSWAAKAAFVCDAQHNMVAGCCYLACVWQCLAYLQGAFLTCTPARSAVLQAHTQMLACTGKPGLCLAWYGSCICAVRADLLHTCQADGGDAAATAACGCARLAGACS